MVEYFNLMKMAHIRAKKMKVGTYSERYTQALAEVQAERGFQKDQKPKRVINYYDNQFNADEMYSKYEKMIYKQAWNLSQKYGVDREELISQGNLIFMEALNRYEVGRVVFGTFLKHRLRTLNDFCISEIYRGNTSVSICDEEKPVNLTDLDFDKFIRTLELLESMTVLTEDARAIIAYLLNGDWEPPVNKQVPSLRLVQNHFEEDGWERSRTKTAWYEIKYWWREQELAV